MQEYLLHFLNFAGTFGDCASNNKSRTHYEKGAGAYENYINRVIDATIDNVKDECGKWPDKEEKI